MNDVGQQHERGAQTASAPERGTRTAPERSWRAVMGDLGLWPALACSALCVAMLGARWAWSGTLAHGFMLWNLFLAWLPWAFALPLAKSPSRPGSGLRLFPFFALWLLFLPNAPYLVTDLLHLSPAARVPLWFDAALFFAFAWTGCLLGFTSLAAVHARVEAWRGRAAGWAFVAAVAVLCGYGIYLGRFLRWNSWDVLVDPLALFRDVLAPLVNPRANVKPIAVTLLFAAFFGAAYGSFAGMRGAVRRRLSRG